MRHPNLNMDNPYSKSGPAQFGQRGTLRPTADPRIANNDTANIEAYGPAHTNGLDSSEHDVSDGTTIRPRTAGQLNGTYDELYSNQSPAPTLNARNNAPATTHPSRLPIQRPQSDIGPRRGVEGTHGQQGDARRMRHGWEEEYTSDEYLSLLSSVSLPRV